MMQKSSVSSHNLGTFPSPGAQDYRERSIGSQKGWSSERSRHISKASFTPTYSGRTLPYKWEDAERWISSPVLGYGACRTEYSRSQRRLRSKSGPLGPMEIAYDSSYSPAMPGLDGGISARNFMVGSPFSTGVLVADVRGGDGGGGGSHLVHSGTAGVLGWLDLLSEEASLLSSQDDEKPEGTKVEEETMDSPNVWRCDMTTQMSPKGSCHSSPKERSPPSLLLAKLEVRDVQVDKRATVTKKSLPDVEDFSSEALASSWDLADAAKDISKLQREEANIAAWENLQKAKAEAAIQKLERKLEKKRSSSMDRILNKLRTAQMNAQEMRNSLALTQVHQPQVPKSSQTVCSLRKLVRLGSLTGCFTSLRTNS